ncbi:hypothetical protein NDU88_003872 [Pleurodeles waltl]|uniref:Secreted protein n=1 Tax=Pleurodeles waltl TaxID=8319 RepID=A0AAV7NHY0_PLEWA|nr:hypothetical protein NDU88_003872 [Pleurodeles waltl]
MLSRMLFCIVHFVLLVSLALLRGLRGEWLVPLQDEESAPGQELQFATFVAAARCSLSPRCSVTSTSLRLLHGFRAGGSRGKTRNQPPAWSRNSQCSHSHPLPVAARLLGSSAKRKCSCKTFPNVSLEGGRKGYKPDQYTTMIGHHNRRHPHVPNTATN